jgi:hypothetical protein
LDRFRHCHCSVSSDRSGLMVPAASVTSVSAGTMISRVAHASSAPPVAADVSPVQDPSKWPTIMYEWPTLTCGNWLRKVRKHAETCSSVTIAGVAHPLSPPRRYRSGDGFLYLDAMS